MVNIITKYQLFGVFLRKIVPFCGLHALYIDRGKNLAMPSFFCLTRLDTFGKAVGKNNRFIFYVDIKSRRWYIIK